MHSSLVGILYSSWCDDGWYSYDHGTMVYRGLRGGQRARAWAWRGMAWRGVAWGGAGGLSTCLRATSYQYCVIDDDCCILSCMIDLSYS